MFIKTNTLRGKNYSYIVMSSRDTPTKKPRQRTLRSLGSEESLTLNVINECKKDFPELSGKLDGLWNSLVEKKVQALSASLDTFGQGKLREYIGKVSLYCGNLKKAGDRSTQESIYGLIRALEEQFIRDYGMPYEVLQAVRNGLIQRV